MFDENIRVYLNSNVRALAALAEIVCSSEQAESAELKFKMIDIIIDSENDMIDFIDSFSIAETDLFTVGSCLRKFLKINGEILGYTEKLQLQGYQLGKVITALKLETQNIKSELFNVSE